jgi:hypothetical protein
MAEYIKFRLTVAKAGVTMALLGLLGGLAERAGADQPRTTEAHAAKTISWTPKLSLKGITGNIRASFVTIERDFASLYAKENKALASDVSSLKHLISVAKDNAYSKLQSNATFLSKTDAGKEYLKIDGKAADAAALGGVPAVQFGMVGSGAVSMGDGSVRQTLLTAPGTNGEIIVVCTPNPTPGAAGFTVSITNNTGVLLPAVQDVGVNSTQVSLAPGTTDLMTFPTGAATAEQLHLQTFPTAGFNRVLTLTVSAEGTGNGVSFVGQMLNGAG